VLENESGETINSCSIDLPGKSFQFKNITPGSKRDFWYVPDQDGEYHVIVKFTSGSVLEDKLGYVTPNLGNRDRLIISHNQIKLVQERLPGLALLLH
jgi:hypothetical protein